jgi:hypothetical protein
MGLHIINTLDIQNFGVLFQFTVGDRGIFEENEDAHSKQLQRFLNFFVKSDAN